MLPRSCVGRYYATLTPALKGFARTWEFPEIQKSPEMIAAIKASPTFMTTGADNALSNGRIPSIGNGSSTLTPLFCRNA